MILVLASGIALVTVVVSFSGALEAKIASIMMGFGPRSVMIIGGRALGPGNERPYWTPTEVATLRSHLSNDAIVSTYKFRKDIPVKAAARGTHTSVYAVDPYFYDALDRSLATGRSLGEADERVFARNCILGMTVAAYLFPDGQSVGKQMLINNARFNVVGVLLKRGVTPLGLDMDDMVLIPFSTGTKRLFQDEKLRAIRLKGAENADMRAVIGRAVSYLRGLRGIVPPSEEDFQVVFPHEAAEQERQATRAVRIGGAVLSLMALLTGGLFVANLRLLAVAQRTGEIGLKRALGAPRAAIFIELLGEFALIVLGGGALGLGLGLALALVMPHVAPSIAMKVTAWPALYTLAACLVVGIVFGVQPALRASRANPVEALRSE